MSNDKEFHERQEYTNELKKIKSEVNAILEDGNDNELSRAARYYPGKIYLFLTQRNIKSASGLFPFFDLAFFNTRKKDIDLLDLNYVKDDNDMLWDVIRRIERELEDL